MSAVVVLIAAVAVAVFLLTRPEDSAIVVEPERAEAVMGSLSTEVDLSGSAIAERSATLSFDVAGVVASVEVSAGDDVREGNALATLNDTDALRQVETAELQLRLAHLRLESLLSGPEASAIASANQSIASAKTQVIGAEQALSLLSEPSSAADLATAGQAVASALGQISSAEQELALLSEPPSAADLASAEQAVASALGQISSAEQELALLSEPPSAADLASAEQAVASALGQISSAEQALALLSEPPSASELRSAEEALASALGQISSTEQALADLTTGPSEAVLAESRSALTQAQVLLNNAIRLEDDMSEVLTEAFDAFCERYSGLIPSDATIRSICASTLPITEEQIFALQESYEDRSTTYETLGDALIVANVAFVASYADKDTALSALTSAEEQLGELLQSVSVDDLYQAEQAVEAAKSSHAAAVARLEELLIVADEEDVYQAEQNLEAARASHVAAVARLGDLQEGPIAEDVYQAEQTLEAARASHAAAVARLDDLQAAADEYEFEEARAALESAQASLASAQANYDGLLAGPTENDIEQQRQEVRLAELSVEEAREALVELAVIAPFDGVVEVVSVQPGDRVTAGLAAFTLYTSDRMLIELTVTEEDLLELDIGQTGVASFDAIDGVNYPVRVASISRVPSAEQGVVTYDVEALILGGPEAANAAGNTPAGGSSPGGGFRGGGPGGGGFAGGALAGLELPEGVTIRQVMEAMINGESLPEGVVLPEGVQVEDLRAMVQGFRQSAGDGAAQGGGSTQAPGGRQGAAGQPAAVAERPLPAPGMSASVTILTEIKDESVLVSTSAVRQLDGAWFVSVPAPSDIEGEVGFERVLVEVGVSDGEMVEIADGLDAGEIVLIGADGAGIAFSATLQQPQANPGFGQFPGGGGPGGGGRR